MVLCKTNQVDKALKLAEDLLENKSVQTYDFKKFFFITIRFLREAVERSSRNEQLINRLKSFEDSLRLVDEIETLDLLQSLRKYSLIYKLDESKSRENNQLGQQSK